MVKSSGAQVLGTVEVILGYCTLGLLISILANKVRGGVDRAKSDRKEPHMIIAFIT